MLAIFLTLSIIALVYIIKLVKQIRRVAEHAENVAESVESAANAFERTATPISILKVIGNIVENANKFKRKKG
jgi:competence protein ComGC